MGYWHDAVVCLSVRLSVTKCIVAKLQVSEQVNRKCPLRTRCYNFQPLLRPFRSPPFEPQTLHGAVWRIH